MTPDASGEDSLGPVSSRPAPAAPTEPAVSLETVLSTDMTIAWDEAVSIVEALCQAVQGNVPRSIPSAGGVFLTGSGLVAARSGAGTPDPVEAGRRLLELLAKGPVPAPLRLFASQAVRADQHPSIVEFQQGLNYFAKPGGQSRIAAVHERCTRELASMPFPSEGEAPPGTPTPPLKTQGKTSGNRQWRREALLSVFAIVVAGMVVSGGYFAWQMLANGSVESEPVPAAEADSAPSTNQLAAPGGGTAAASSRAAVTREALPPAAGLVTAPGGRTAAASTRTAVAREAIPPAGGLVNAPSGAMLAPRRNPLDLDLGGAGGLAPPPPPVEIDENTGISGAASDAPPSAPLPIFVQDTAAAPAEPERVYSASDAGIVPATLVREQLLPPAMVPSGAAPLQLELVVSAEGAVERARFLVRPRRMADMMLLSSAKTWTFNPALKDGRPVRSRVVLSWFVAP
jgi:hypothetical protein